MDRWLQLAVAIGFRLLGPLFLHFLVWMASTGGDAAGNLGAFDAWISMTLPIAGLAHVVLAFRAAAFGPRIRERSTDELRRMPSSYGWMTLLFTAIAGLIPGAILLLVPPVLIALTGLVFVPYSFYRMSRAIHRERVVVDDLVG